MLLGSGGRRSVCLWRCRLLSVPSGEQASGRRWDCSGHIWATWPEDASAPNAYSDVPGGVPEIV